MRPAAAPRATAAAIVVITGSIIFSSSKDYTYIPTHTLQERSCNRN
ncbi:hypothetical protein H206_05402 [Candidatus Electrothrix aarhusensis]|uniref:Uncharacterized protein n=1 Tax=Candidatus Electrothrix aarhusensis TaxID=1859131 RepID=A0A444J4Q6_9BACT|nr:hypothetical protein H206_05402 [Candidatus Electrothrix aarhusensis]